MIQAGTIRTGSARTSGVAGAYWMSSIRRLRKTTLPGVIATSWPTAKASVPAGFPTRCQPLPVVPEIERAANEIHAALLEGLRDHLGIGERKILGRDRVQHLARQKRHDVFMVLADAGHIWSPPCATIAGRAESPGTGH